MIFRILPASPRTTAWLAAALAGVVVMAVGLETADAQTNRRYVTQRDQAIYGPRGPNVSYQAGPRTRVYVTKRSWLDAGTEVLPGERKFQDYAFPPAVGYPSFARENLNRPIDRQPLSPPYDLGGYPERFPLY